MTDKYTALRAALDAGPTPGPWCENPLKRNQICKSDASVPVALVCEQANPSITLSNARLIAACDPDTIRALLADADRTAVLEAENGRLREVLSNVVRYFPTDTDMEAACCSDAYIESACKAYDKARAALAQEQGDEDA